MAVKQAGFSMQINHLKSFGRLHSFLRIVVFTLLLIFSLHPILAKRATLDIRRVVSNADWSDKELNKRMLAISNDEFVRHWKARNVYQMEYDFYAIGDYLLFRAFMPHCGSSQSFLCYNPKTNKLSIAFKECEWPDTGTTYIATEEDFFPTDVCRTGFGSPFYNDTLIVAKKSSKRENFISPQKKRAAKDYILTKEYATALKALERNYDSTCLSQLNVWDSIEKKRFVEFREFIYSKHNSKVHSPLMLKCIEISKKMFYDVESLNMGMWWPSCHLEFNDGHTSMEWAIKVYSQLNTENQYDSCLAVCYYDLAIFQMNHVEIMDVYTRDAIKSNLEQAYSYYFKLGNRRSAAVLRKLGLQYQLEKDYSKAKQYFLLALKETGEYYGESSREYAEILNKLRDVSYQLNEYKVAASYAQQYIDTRCTCQGDIDYYFTEWNDKYLFLPTIYSDIQASQEYVIYSSSCLKKRKLEELDKYYSKFERWDRVYNIRKELYEWAISEGDSYDRNAKLNELIKVCKVLGDVRNEEIYLQKQVDNVLAKSGEESEEYAVALLNLCDFYQRTNDSVRAFECANKAMSIEANSQQRLKFEEILTRCGKYAIWAENYRNAEICFDIIIKYKSQIYGQGYLNTSKAKDLEPLAELYLLMGRTNDAIEKYKEIGRLAEQPDGEKILNYKFMGRFLEELGNDTLAVAAYYKGNLFEDVESVLYKHRAFKDAEYFINYHFESIKSEMASKMIVECEAEREILWEKNNQYITQILPQYCYEAYLDSTDYSALAYNVALYTKGYLLSTSQAIQNIILGSQDNNLIKKWRELLVIQDVMTQSSLSSDSLAVLQEKARYIEQQILTTNSELIKAKQGRSLGWKDVKKSLKSNEVAIEFTSFYDSQISSRRYCAILLRKTQKSPIYIPLFTEEDLSSVIAERPELNYESSDCLFNLIWSKIIPYIKVKDIVYFAPDGELYSLNIELLSNAKGQNVISYCGSVVRLSSTRELAMRKVKSIHSTATLYGGIQYNMTGDEFLAKSEQYTSYNLLASRGIENDTLDRGSVKYLPGTKKEVEQINQMLTSNRLPVQLYTATNANEESFKALSGKRQNILHIATHGFYWSDSIAKRADYFSQRKIMTYPTCHASVIDPLNRCGLLFAGANTALSGHSADLPDGVQDGILTAKEISLLDLRDADLVVLSACETGKGDITGDGVFGLQRAFKQAGAQTIIMSLWAVDDSATEFFMTEFYRNWITGHQSKRTAFCNAQSATRTKYPEPVYWAGFVMMD